MLTKLSCWAIAVATMSAAILSCGEHSRIGTACEREGNLICDNGGYAIIACSTGRWEEYLRCNGCEQCAQWILGDGSVAVACSGTQPQCDVDLDP